MGTGPGPRRVGFALGHGSGRVEGMCSQPHPRVPWCRYQISGGALGKTVRQTREKRTPHNEGEDTLGKVVEPSPSVPHTQGLSHRLDSLR
jgi:hypothetical protein